MKATGKIATAVAALAAMTVVLALPAGAHVAVGKPAVSCDEASVELKSFPSGQSEITFHIKVNGTESTKTTTLNGSDGTVKVTISDLTTATGSLNIEAFAQWTVDGGGKSDTTKVTKTCHETPPPSSGTPPLEVGGVTADRPVSTPSPASAATGATTAASSVTASPRFTG